VRIGQMFDEACQALVERATSAGDWIELRRRAEHWVFLRPHTDASHRALVVAHAHLGNRLHALEAYDRMVRGPCAELDIAPDEEIELLVRRLRGAEPLPSAQKQLDASVGRDLPLVGRSIEFSGLSRAWDAARLGRRHLVVVTGEAGSGKTRLVTEFARRARHEGATVLHGRGYEVERGIPYAMLAGALAQALEAPGLSATDPQLLAELCRILPQLARKFPPGNDAATPDQDLGRFRLQEAARAVVDALASEQPVLIVLDDLPFADAASLAAIHYIWRTLTDAPVMMLATARSEDSGADSDTARLLLEARREDGRSVEEVALPPLGPESVAALVQLLGVEHEGELADYSAALVEETGGNALFVVETLRSRNESLRDSPGATTLAAVARDRIARLSAQGRRLLQAASVIGRRFPLSLARAVAGLEPESAHEVVEELLGKGLLREVEYRYDFSHDLVRRNTYEALRDDIRCLLHERAYERLLPEGATEDAGLDRCSALARHAGEAGLHESARRWLLEAATLAERLFAGAEAEAFLQQALRHSRTPKAASDTWLRLGNLMRVVSRFGAAANAYIHAIRHVPPGRERLRLRLRLIDVSARAGLVEPQTAGEALEDIVRRTEGKDFGLQRDVLAALADLEAGWGRPEAASGYARRAVSAARGAGEPEAVVRCLLLHSRLALSAGLPDEVLPAAEEALQISTNRSLAFEWRQAAIELGNELSRRGHWDQAEALWRETLARSERFKDFGAVAVTSLNLSDLCLRRASWAMAAAYLEKGEAVCERFDFPHLDAAFRVNRSLLAFYQGNRADAIRLAAEAASVASTYGIKTAERTARAVAALAHLGCGSPDAAAAEIARMGELGEGSQSSSDEMELVLLAKARHLACSGDYAGARKVLHDGRRVRDAFGRLLLSLEEAHFIEKRDPERAVALGRRVARAASRLGAAWIAEEARRMFDSA
jgi:tetratricopeptide (TPR) repeat protein